MAARLMLLGLIFAQLADAATFTVGVALHGIGLESNHIAVAAHNAGGVQTVLIMKGAAILAALAIVVLSAHRFPKVLVLGSATATSFGLLGFLANTASLMILAR